MVGRVLSNMVMEHYNTISLILLRVGLTRSDIDMLLAKSTSSCRLCHCLPFPQPMSGR